MRPGRHRTPVMLARSPKVSGDDDGFFEPLDPAAWWASLEPMPPGSGESKTVTHLITCRFHPGISLDTWITFADPVQARTREFQVLGYQNVEERNRELRLLCQEIQP